MASRSENFQSDIDWI